MIPSHERARTRTFWQNVAAAQAMKTSKKFAIINVGILLGLGLSLFKLPPDTSFSLWLGVAAFVTAALNFLLYKTQRKSADKPQVEPLPAIIGWVFTAVFLLDVVFHVFYH
jgi:hypothetical protein